MSARRLCFIGWADHVHLERWAGYFARKGDEVSVVSYSSPGRYPASVRQHGLGEGARGPRWRVWRLRYLLWRLRPALVHVHWAHFAVDVRKAWRGPMVVTAWGSDVYLRDRFSAQQWQDLGIALRSSDLVTCDSEDLAVRLRREFDLADARVQVIQWGVDTDAFTPRGTDLRKELALDGREVVYSARNFTPVYNQLLVVRAFHLVHRKRPSAYLLMKNYGGDADYVAAVQALISELGLHERVRILDQVDYEQMPVIYRTADVTVSVPVSDATPMSVLEAMASGSIVVVGALPSLLEWIDPGRTGFVVESLTPETLADMIDLALGSKGEGSNIRAAARHAVESRAGQRVHMDVASRHYSALIEARQQRQGHG